MPQYSIMSSSKNFEEYFCLSIYSVMWKEIIDNMLISQFKQNYIHEIRLFAPDSLRACKTADSFCAHQ